MIRKSELASDASEGGCDDSGRHPGDPKSTVKVATDRIANFKVHPGFHPGMRCSEDTRSQTTAPEVRSSKKERNRPTMSSPIED